MTSTTYSATFRNGLVATRTSEATYTHASRRQGSAVVRFHTSETAARKAAGAHGSVVPTVHQAAAPAEGAVKPGELCTIVMNGGTCGKPGVTSFVSRSSGARYVECAEHAV